MFEELQFKITADSAGNTLEGGKNYQFQLPSDLPAKNFWSVILYDKQDNFLIRTDQPWPSVHNYRTHLLVNEDGSVDTYFGPEAPRGKENNWVKTIPGKEWYMILRIYDLPLNPLNNSWKPNTIQIMEKFNLQLP